MQPKPKESISKILVVDDEPVIREQVAQMLQDFGHRTFTAGSGEEAMALARRESPDVILLDLKMPGISGIETCQKLREDPATHDVRIIVISGMDAKEALEESIIAGADDFLAKPIDAIELSVRVRSMLRVRNIHDDERRIEAYIRNLHAMRGHQRRIIQ